MNKTQTLKSYREDLKVKKKIVSILLCTSMVASVLAGCGGEAEETTTETPAAEEEAEEPAEEAEAEAEEETEASEDGAASTELAYTGELSIMHYSTSEESEGNGGSDGFRTMLAEWQEAHPDITLNENVLANDEYKTQIATLAGSVHVVVVQITNLTFAGSIPIFEKTPLSSVTLNLT